MSTSRDNVGKMRGGVRDGRGPHGKPGFYLDLGVQPAQRCPVCTAAKKRPNRWWLGHRPLPACPNCGAALRNTSERRQQWMGGFETKAEAKKARINALHELGQGTHVARDDLTLGEWLTDEWLPSLAVGKLRETTRASYRSHVDNHLAPTKLGTIRLQQLTRERISAHYAWLQRGGEDRGRPLAASTLHHIHVTLHRALRDAVRANLLARNPADDIELPGVGNQARDAKINAWSAAELAAFLGATKDERLHVLWHTLAMTGMRRGEALALRWDDIDLEHGFISVSKSRVGVDGVVRETPTKSDRARVVQIDSATIAVLRAHAQAQLEELADAAEALEAHFVFTTAAGDPLVPCTVSHWFSSAVVGAALPKLSLHGLRHTHATLLLQAGVPAKIVQERLGHRSITITMDIYSHVTPGMDADAARIFGRLVAAAGAISTSL
ncbi:MAG: tyrosine-type recombinase/integrase [Thermoleophilia bacterium]